VQVAGLRYYNPGLERWTARDPIGERGGLLLYEFAGNGPVGWIDAFGLINWQFSGSWDPAHQADVSGRLALIQSRIPQMQVRLVELRLRMLALPDSCPLKSLLLAGYQSLSGHLVDLKWKLASSDTVELDEYDFGPSDGNYAVTHAVGIGPPGNPWIGLPFNHVSFNTRSGYFFDSDPDFRTTTVFHELLHLPGVGLWDPGLQDPFNNPDSFDSIILNPTGFGLGGAVEQALWKQVLGTGNDPKEQARLTRCCGKEALQRIFRDE
jgi:uncharacterized protein RhaS with RHS repeats